MKNLKKLLISSLFLGYLFVPIFASAQTVPTDNQVIIQRLEAQIALLEQLLALMTQLNNTATQQSQTLNQVVANQTTQAQIDSPSPSPSLGSVQLATVTIGNQICATQPPKAKFPVTLSGVTPILTLGLSWKTNLTYQDFPRTNNLADKTKSQSVDRSIGIDANGNLLLPDDINSTVVSGSINTDKGDIPVSQTVTVATCQ